MTTLDYKQKQIIIGCVLAVFLSLVIFALFLGSQDYSSGAFWFALSSPLVCIPVVFLFLYWVYKMVKLRVFA